MLNSKALLAFLLLAMESVAYSLDVVAETTPTERRTLVAETVATQYSLYSTTSIRTSLSPAWIEADELNSKLFTFIASNNEGYLTETMADLRSLNNYWLNNPNVISSSPLGALCWIYHELERGEVLNFLRQEFDQILDEIVGSLGIVNENSNGQKTVDVLLEFLTSEEEDIENNGTVGIVNEDDSISKDNIYNIPDFLTTGDEKKLTKDALISFYRTPIMIEWIRVNDSGAGDGTEWSSAVRSVLQPEVVAAISAGHGLSEEVQIYADALFQSIRNYISSGQTAPSDFYGSNLPGYYSFIEEAKYSQDCQRLSYNLETRAS